MESINDTIKANDDLHDGIFIYFGGWGERKIVTKKGLYNSGGLAVI